MAVKTSLSENISIALQSISGNRLRASLTSLIIAIGIMALVGILTSIEGIKSKANDIFGELGANTFSIQNSGNNLNFGNGGHRKVYPPITFAQADRFKRSFNMPVTTSIDLVLTGTAVVKHGNIKSSPNIYFAGSDENYLLNNGKKLAYGRNFSTSEIEHAEGVVIIGDEIKKKLFKNEDPINQYIFVGKNRFRIIGIVQSKGSSSGFGPGDKFCVIPVTKAKQLDSISSPSFTVTIKGTSAVNLETVKGEAISVFRNARGLDVSRENNFELSSNESIQQELGSQIAYMTYGGLAIAIITLLGASIGLMNIMLVSVTERTREIGVRKAIGATPSVIRKQFLIEAVLICLMGGIAGIILGIAIGNVIAVSVSGSFTVPWLWLLISVCVCTIIGLLSGFYPAQKASRLDPVEALRYE